jgi:hypothetical protein
MLSEDRRPLVHEALPKPARPVVDMSAANQREARLICRPRNGKASCFPTSTPLAPISDDEPATDAFGDVPAGGHGLISVA